MKKENILNAVEDAKRFLEAVKEWEKSDINYWDFKNSANVKRKSMDLTRSLSKMRQEK